MAMVKSFRVHPQFGVPDKDIREWLSLCEKKGIIAVTTTFIPAVGESDPRLNVIVTFIDEPLETYDGSSVRMIPADHQL